MFLLISKKSQIIFEFVMFILLAIFLVLILIGISFKISSTIVDNQAYSELNDLARSIQEEFILAWQVSEGYNREIYIPSRLQRGNFSMNNSEEMIFFIYDGHSLSLTIPIVNGTLQKGYNMLIHENETLYIKQ